MSSTAPHQAPEAQEDNALSLETVFTAIHRFWYLIALCAALGGFSAWYYAGTQSFVYEKTASLILKDESSSKNIGSADRILSELGADPAAANLANESFVLKSTALMQRVVEKLKLNTIYWQYQGLRLVDLYKSSPLLVNFISINTDRTCRVEITPSNNQDFSLSYLNSQDEPVSVEGSFNTPLELPFATISVHPTSSFDDSTPGSTIIVDHSPTINMTRDLLKVFNVVRPDEKEASLLEMTISCHNPQKAEDILNELIVAYNENSQEEKSEAARKTDAFIRTRLDEIGQDLTQVDEQISESKENANVLRDTEIAFGADFATTQTIKSTIEEILLQQKLAASLHDNLVACRNKGMLLTVDSGVKDPAIALKVEAYNETYLEYTKISKSAGSRNPIAVSLREQMLANLQAAHTTLDNYRNTLNLQLQEQEKNLQELEARMASTVDAEKSLVPLIREHKVKEELYMLLLAKEQENALALAVAAPGAKVLESAYGSDDPVAPRTLVFTAAGTAGGAALCLGAILAIGMLDNKVNSKQDLTPYSHQPVLAELPSLSRKDKKQHSVFVQDPHSTMAECLHILRNNLENLLPRDQHHAHIIMMTSTTPNEGKTLVSANLAAAFAQAGRRVLIIDADLRKTSLSRALGGKGRSGLTNLLLNHVSQINEVIHPFPSLPNLAGSAHVLFAGTSVPNPVTLLSTPKFGEILQSLSPLYDAIIIDAPPHGILADSDIIAQFAHTSLYLVRAGRVVRKYFSQVQKLADSGKLPNLAFVINDVNFRANSYNYYGYGYAYGYYRYGYSHKGKKSKKA